MENVTILRLHKTNLVSFHVKSDIRRVESLVLTDPLQRKHLGDKYQAGVYCVITAL